MLQVAEALTDKSRTPTWIRPAVLPNLVPPNPNRTTFVNTFSAFKSHWFLKDGHSAG